MVKWWWGWLGCWIVMGQALADPVTATGRVPLRPPDGIYDQSGWLREPSRAGMVRNILSARENGDSSVFVVVLEGLPDDVESVAFRWGRTWGKGGVWGMILHVPGEEGFPRYFAELTREPAWGEAEKEEFEKSLKESLRKVGVQAGGIPEERQRVEMATRVMAEGLGYLGVVMARIDHRFAQVRGKPKDEPPVGEKGRVWIGLWWQIGFAFFGLLVLVFLFLLFRSSEEEPVDDFLFPETEPRKRFRAPWSGGGNVLIEFRRRKR